MTVWLPNLHLPQVPRYRQQSDVMLEAVTNHGPDGEGAASRARLHALAHARPAPRRGGRVGAPLCPPLGTLSPAAGLPNTGWWRAALRSA